MYGMIAGMCMLWCACGRERKTPGVKSLLLRQVLGIEFISLHGNFLNYPDGPNIPVFYKTLEH